MTVFRALASGLGRVIGAPVILVSLYLITLLITVPAGLLVRASIAAHLGSSAAAHRMADGIDADWWDEFTAQAQGLERTVTPSIIGFAAVLTNASALADAEAQQPAVIGLVVAYLLVWTFLTGGALDRYARQRATRSAGFFSACGVYFLRFLRLAVIAAPLYWILFATVHPWLFGRFFDQLTRDWTVERDGFLLRAGLYAVFAVLVGAVNLLFDYAQIRTVVEDRRSMVVATAAAFRFVRRRPGQTVGLYLTNGLLLVAVMATYAQVAPGAGSTGRSMWIAFLVGQAYVSARLLTKLTLMASQTAYFQSQLAHATYTAAPHVGRAESPAAEAMSPPEAMHNAQ